MSDWLHEMKAELEQAKEARRRGQEGRARVCARRAAGMAAREFLRRRQEAVRNSSSYDVLLSLARDTSLSSTVRRRAGLLVERVDEQFRLPADVDLILEARQLAEELLGVSSSD